MKLSRLILLVTFACVVGFAGCSKHKPAKVQKKPAIIQKPITEEVLAERQRLIEKEYRDLFLSGLSDIPHLLIKDNFAALEQMADKFRIEKTRTVGGRWQLKYFYRNLAYAWDEMGIKYEDALMEHFKKWQEAYPNSVKPLIAMAYLHVRYGWEARGSGYSNTVDDAGWDEFFRRLDIAWELLQKAEMLEEKDPELYAAYIMTAKGLGEPKISMYRFFNKGVEIEKCYCNLYNQMVSVLLPRWYGVPGELQKFMDQAVKITGEEEGNIIYARMTNVALNYWSYDTMTKKHGISYSKAKDGFEEMMAKYQFDPYLVSRYCYLECCKGDRENAVKLFNELGDSVESVSFKSKKTLTQYKNWAFETSPSN